MYDFAYHATSLQALQNGADAHSEKGSDHCRNRKQRRGTWGNSRHNSTLIKTGGSTPTSTAMPTTNGSPVMEIRFNSQSICRLDTLCTNGTNATYVESATFCRCPENSHRWAQWTSIPSYVRLQFAALPEKNLRNLPSKPQKRFRYQPESRPRGPEQQMTAKESKFVDHKATIYAIDEKTV